MKYSVGKKVKLFDPYLSDVIWEIYRYSNGVYRLWDYTQRYGIKVKEDEIRMQYD